MSIETRPDTITKKEIKLMRKFGITRVEMGVQTIDEKVLKIIKRGHSQKEIINATKLLKDSGFKVCYHLMPNLPASTWQKDYQVVKVIFDDQRFRPDQLKIYPCLLIPGTELEKLFKKGKWEPYDDQTMIELLTKIKANIIPPYVRIMRLWRDIPKQELIAGSMYSHMRQLVSKNLKQNLLSCSCIRCREIKDLPHKKLILDRIDYQASSNKEIFLQFVDDNNSLYALARLRILKNPFIPALKNSAIIRELHVYGPSRPIIKTFSSNKFIQHKGLGKKLVQACEKITKTEFNLSKITVISGVGVRDYYQKLGYELVDEYMMKKL